MTIPKGTLFPMCGMNLTFDRDLIGPAMYFGLMGDGQPIGRYDDMWAGWCIKVRLLCFCCHIPRQDLVRRNWYIQKPFTSESQLLYVHYCHFIPSTFQKLRKILVRTLNSWVAM